MTQAYPLQWPDGWPRAPARKSASFGKTETARSGDHSWKSKRGLTLEEAVKRVWAELERLGVKHPRDDSVISTNLRLNLSGFPRGDQGEPGDPGVAIYWQAPHKPMKVMAIDRYYRVRDNIAAIAATLEAMRAIERHGGAQILDRAFTGFTALPAPKKWHDILGVAPEASREEINARYRRLAADHHPDHGGSHDRMAELTRARDEALKEKAA